MSHSVFPRERRPGLPRAAAPPWLVLWAVLAFEIFGCVRAGLARRGGAFAAALGSPVSGLEEELLARGPEAVEPRDEPLRLGEPASAASLSIGALCGPSSDWLERLGAALGRPGSAVVLHHPIRGPPPT